MRYLSVVVAVLALGCQGVVEPGPVGQGPVRPGASVDMAALIANAGVTGAVTWTIDPGGGTITQAGVYTAPSCATLIAALPVGTDLTKAGQIVGTDRVTATWTGGSTVILVTVSEAVLGVEVTPTSVSVPPGGTATFVATIHYTCHDAVTGP